MHRNSLFDAQYTTNWSPAGTTSAEINNQHTWIRGYWNSMRPYASGQAYQNYIDPEQPNWQQAYYGANYPRLQQVSARTTPPGCSTSPRPSSPPPPSTHVTVPVTG